MEEEDLAEYFRMQYGERLLQLLQWVSEGLGHPLCARDLRHPPTPHPPPSNLSRLIPIA